MLEKTFSLLFYLKKPKNYLKGQMPIYLRITVDGIPKEISTGRQCAPDRWNANAGRSNGTKEDVKSLNAYLDTLQTKVYEARRQLLEKNELITSETLRNVLKGTNENAKMIMKIFQQHNEEVESLIGKDFSPATLERYKTSFDHTKSFMQWKYGISDMDIKKLDYEFVSQYEFWLKSIRKCAHNTTIKYISNFRKIVNRCIRNDWLDRDPFVGFKMTKKEVIPEFLTEHEINKIASKKFTAERLEQIRDVFLFCCYKAWIQLDFNNKDKNNNNEVKQYHENYGYNLKAAIGKFPVAELDGGEKEKSLLQSLQKGNIQSVTITVDGEQKKMFIEANPQYKTVNLYNDRMQRLGQEQRLDILEKHAVKELKEEKVIKENKQEDVKQDNKKAVKQKQGNDLDPPKKKNSRKKGMSM